MPQDLNCRLEMLEKEIHGLLKIHEQQCSDIQTLMPYATKNPSRLNRVRSGTQVQPTTISGKSCNKTKSVIDSPWKNVCLKQVQFANIQNRGNQFSGAPDGCTKKNGEKENVEHTYKIISDLKEELSFSKARMCAMAKDMALLTDALQSIRTKYKNIKIFRKDVLAQIEELKKINAELCRKLEEEMKHHADQIHFIKEREIAKIELKVKQDASVLMEQSEEAYNRVQKANEQLKVDMKSLRSKYVEAQNEVESLKTELYNYNKNILAHKQENEDLKSLLKAERNKNIVINENIDKLEATVADLMKVEKKAQSEINVLKDKIINLEQNKYDHKEKLLAKNKEYTLLEHECERLRNQLQQFACEDNTKCKRIEVEMDKLKKQMEDREYTILEEKNTLKSLVQELSDIVKRHKARIKELVQINRQQEGLLKNQMIILRNKEHQVRVAEIEVESAKGNCENLEEQINKLKYTLKTYENEQNFKKNLENEQNLKLNSIIEELNNTKSMLQEEQDKLLIKEKIIDDQADSIRKLKNSICFQGEEIKTHNGRIANLQRQLDNEKYDKEQLQQNIEDITWHKEQLKLQIIELEAALKEKIIKKNQDNKKQQLVHFEPQLKEKQKEWELKCRLLNKEKKKAVQAAKFATQKLVDTVNDFQAQTKSQKYVQFMVNKIVHTKINDCDACPKDMINEHEAFQRKK